MYEDGIDGDSLMEVVARGIKLIDIGAAVLPKPLYRPDVDELSEDEDLLGHEEQQTPTSPPPSRDLLGDENGAYEPPDTSRRHHQLDKTGRSRNRLPPDTSREGKAPEYYNVSPQIPTRYAKTLRREFNAIVVEHHAKWSPLCVSDPGPLPQPSTRLGAYDFHHVDSIVDWALKHGKKVKGHVLVWHVSSPEEILEAMSPDQVREQLRRHIFTTMGHFRGRIHVWDVVNEALAPDGTLAETVFLRKLGPGYIEDCFRWAHEADPDAVLLYNDNKVEGMNGPNKRKADGFFRLLAGLVKKGVPIHGCSIQAHFNAAGTGRNRPPTPRMVKNQIRRLGLLGLKVNISEMDVRVSQLAPNLRQIAQRQIYHDIIAAALTEPAFDGVWLWGFSDRFTWVSHFYYDDEPLIFDEDYGRKEAYYGLRDALLSITPGAVVGGKVPLETDEDEEGRSWGHVWMQPEPENGGSIESRSSFSEHDNVAGLAADTRPDWELP